MYEDSWYSFVPEITTKNPPNVAPPPLHRRSESLVQQLNGTSKADDVPEPLEKIYEDIEDSNTPPDTTLTRRVASCPDVHRLVKAQRAKDGSTQRTRRKATSWEALTLCDQASAIRVMDEPAVVVLDQAFEDKVLQASQQDYLLYHDQLELTERHLDGLVDDANAALKLLTSLSNSFQSVEAQTTSFQSKCEGLLSEQNRLEKLADEVGTDLHYYAYLEAATRRLNGPGASRLVEDDAFGDMVENIDSCIGFMTTHESYRERDSYLARYNALLTKALYLLDHAFTGRLEKVSPEIARQMAATKSDSARHALAYGRFEEMMNDSYALLPNIQRAVRCAYDAYGRPADASPVSAVYANSAANIFGTYLRTRDRDLKVMTLHRVEEFQKEAKGLSVETACRNFIKQSFDKLYNEDGLFSRVFGVEPTWNSAPGSAFQAIKAVNTSMAHPGNMTPLAAELQAVLQTAGLQAVCSVVGWLASEYSISESDDEESPSFRKYREYAARLLVEHLWSFADGMFAAEVTRSISKAPMPDGALKIEAAAEGAGSSGAHPLVKRAMELLSMFDQAMPKERSTKNSSVVFNIVRETVTVLQRAEARIRSLKTGTDADLFMIQNLLVIKNELFSLEIGDTRSQQPQSMQHFGRIWDTLSPQNWVGFLGSILGGSLWGRAPPAVTAKTLTAEDMGEQLDELLRQSIYAFARRWGTLVNESQSRSGAGARPVAKVEAELDGLLTAAFRNHPEVVAKLKEAIRLNAQAQSTATDAKRGAKRY